MLHDMVLKAEWNSRNSLSLPHTNKNYNSLSNRRQNSFASQACACYWTLKIAWRIFRGFSINEYVTSELYVLDIGMLSHSTLFLGTKGKRFPNMYTWQASWNVEVEHLPSTFFLDNNRSRLSLSWKALLHSTKMWRQNPMVCNEDLVT